VLLPVLLLMSAASSDAHVMGRLGAPGQQLHPSKSYRAAFGSAQQQRQQQQRRRRRRRLQQ